MKDRIWPKTCLIATSFGWKVTWGQGMITFYAHPLPYPQGVEGGYDFVQLIGRDLPHYQRGTHAPPRLGGFLGLWVVVACS